MKSTTQSTISPRRALMAATIAALLSAGLAFAQSSGTSAGSSQKPSSTSGSTGSSTYGSSRTDTSTSSTTAGAPTGRETTTSGKLAWTDRRFVNKASDGGQEEVALAQLAAQRATNPEVRTFAQKLADDHTQVNSELTSIASQKNVKLDDEDVTKDRTYKRLAKKSGMEFDQEFVEHMIDEHEKNIKMFEKASTEAKDAEIRSFAAKHVDHLRDHLKQAQDLRQTLMPTGRMEDSSSRSPTTPSTSSGARDRDSGSSGTTSSGSSTSSGSGSTTPKRDTSR